MAEAMPRIGHEDVGRPALCSGVEPVDPFQRRKIGLHGFDRDAEGAKVLGGLVNLCLVGRDDEIIAVLGTKLGELVADARGGAGDDGERAWGLCHGSNLHSGQSIAIAGSTGQTLESARPLQGGGFLHGLFQGPSMPCMDGSRIFVTVSAETGEQSVLPSRGRHNVHEYDPPRPWKARSRPWGG